MDATTSRRHGCAPIPGPLSHLPPQRIEAILQRGLPRLTRLTITNPDALRRDLATIRAQGYSVTFGESHDGVHGVAAPIRDHTGRVVASVSVLAPAVRIPRSRIPELIEKVTETARRISRDLGYAGPAAPAADPGRKARRA